MLSSLAPLFEKRCFRPTARIFKVVNFYSRGRNFILSQLKLKDIEEYWKQLLKKYAKLMKWKPQRNAKLLEIKPKQRDEL